MSIAVITGASSGIGAEFARQLALDSSIDEIWLIARSKKGLEKTATEIATKTRIIPMDLSERSSFQSLAELLKQENYAVSALVNSAGFGKNGDFRELDLNEQLSMIDVNCRAVVQMTQTVVPFMGPGSIIYNISSISGFAPLGAFAIYGASKAFVNSFSIAIRSELSPKDIQVLTVAPGSVDTNFQTISRGTSTREKRLFAKKSSPVAVVRQAIKDGRRRRVFSLYGPTAIAARLLRRIISHRFLATLSYTKIYPKK